MRQNFEIINGYLKASFKEMFSNPFLQYGTMQENYISPLSKEMFVVKEERNSI